MPCASSNTGGKYLYFINIRTISINQTKTYYLFEIEHYDAI